MLRIIFNVSMKKDITSKTQKVYVMAGHPKLGNWDDPAVEMKVNKGL